MSSIATSTTTSPSVLEQLRDRIRDLEGVPVHRRRIPSLVPTLDRLVGGIPTPGLLEIVGAPGSGRVRLALALAAAWTTRRKPVAWADLAHLLYPPGAAELGVDLQHFLIVRPSSDQSSWAVEQMMRSGCFPLVFAHLPSKGRRLASGPAPPSSRPVGHRWHRAVEQGQCTGVIVSDYPLRGLQAHIRIAIDRDRAFLLRDRSGRTGRSEALPPREIP